MMEPDKKKQRIDVSFEYSYSSLPVEEFKFADKRVRVLTKVKEVLKRGKAIVYWMSREQRVQDNWAFIHAQRLALLHHLPLYVVFCLVPKFLDATIRHYDFMLGGLAEVESECRSLGIQFHLLPGQPVNEVPQFAAKQSAGAVVVDFSPLRVPLGWVNAVAKALPTDVPLYQVDAHNIVPVWVTSDKLEYAARTIRPKIHKHLGDYLTEFPKIERHPYRTMEKDEKSDNSEIDWKVARSTLEVNMEVQSVEWARPGASAAKRTLLEFLSNRIAGFAEGRNDPNKPVLSNISPWLHFGQISAQRCAIEVQKKKQTHRQSVEVFIEESVVRRELADNFCFYNSNYDSLEGAYDWARQTLEQHSQDPRPYLYSRQQLESGDTHDRLWNAAQLQMVKEAKMHGYIRMYWAKKILEWTSTPAEALSIAIYLNDKYSLDGRDPNGYVGCMWSICGIHDQGWPERKIFGKIRYMNFDGCKRKFDVAKYSAKYAPPPTSNAIAAKDFFKMRSQSDTKTSQKK